MTTLRIREGSIMDDRTQEAAETTLEHELFFNERVVTHPKLGSIKMTRPTLEHDRLIAEERRRQFQRDIKDPDILSREEIAVLASKRGMWSDDMDKRIDELTAKTGEAMGMLEGLGFKDFDGVLADYDNAVKDVLALFPAPPEGDEANVEIRERVFKYFNLSEEAPTFQERTWITDRATSSELDEKMERAELIRTQLDVLKRMGDVNKELDILHVKRTRLFVDSVEARADRAQQLATMFYCCRNADTGTPLWPSIEAMRNAPIEDVDFVMAEYQLFQHGITEEFRSMLSKYGFRKRLSDTGDSSDASPVQPSTNSDGASAASAPTPSSEA